MVLSLETTVTPLKNADENNNSNSDSGGFLAQLASSFNVTSTPLAIFILVMIILGIVLSIVSIILCVRSVIRRRRIIKKRPKQRKSIYMDELTVASGYPSEYGQLTYKLSYDLITQTLTIMIVEARGLKTVPETKQIDAYATLRMAQVTTSGPPKQIGETSKTEMKRGTNLPRWHFARHEKIAEHKLKDTVLRFEIFDYDSIGQDMSIARLDVPLASKNIVDLVSGELEYIDWLQAGSPRFMGIGEVCLGLTWQPVHERLEVHIYEARNLKVSHRMGKELEPLLMVHVELRDGSRPATAFNTSLKANLINPYFNDKHTFSLKKDRLKSARLTLELVRKGRIRRSKVLGTMTLSSGSGLSTGEKHWQEMIQSSPRMHVMWHLWISVV